MFLSFNLFFNTEKWAFLEMRIEIDRNFQSLFWTTEVLQERYWEKFKILEQLASDQRQVPRCAFEFIEELNFLVTNAKLSLIQGTGTQGGRTSDTRVWAPIANSTSYLQQSD